MIAKTLILLVSCAWSYAAQYSTTFPPAENPVSEGGHWSNSQQQFSFCHVGRARHSVRAGPRAPASERRARSDAPYHATHSHNENC
jgi:hypothetical protein